MGGVGPIGGAVDAPVLDVQAGLKERVELPEVEQPVAEFAVERLRPPFGQCEAESINSGPTPFMVH